MAVRCRDVTHWAQSRRLVARESLQPPRSLQHLGSLPAETYMEASGNSQTMKRFLFGLFWLALTAAVAAALLKLAFGVLPLI